jgi:hypothetical protein
MVDGVTIHHVNRSFEKMPTYRVNTGECIFRNISADNVEAACEFVRNHQFPNYAYPKWLEIKVDGEWKRLEQSA